MTNLVKCPCGHTLSQHDMTGCKVAHFANDCSCKLTVWRALDAAIAEVRRPGPPIYSCEKKPYLIRFCALSDATALV
jgi:hypothetical protein